MSTVLAKADALQAKTKKKPLRNGKVMKAKGLKKPSARKSKVNYRTTTQLRSDRFLAEIKNATRVTFVSHINPDPDSIGSMVGLAHLVKSVLGKKIRLTRDGLINRSENRAMVDLLGLELVPMDGIEWHEGDVAVMVDSQPKTGRHSNENGIPLVAVIDHHDTPGNVRGIPFVDVRKSMGATCSVVAEYLREQNVEVSFKVATAMMYGMETELMGFPRHASSADEEALLWLFPKADKDLLAEIRNARLPQSHFEGVVQALQSSFIYDRLIISWVHDLPQPELAAEVVDFLIRFEEVDWAVCAGLFENKLILSARASGANAKAGELLKKVVGRMGRAGGHDRRAGGAILMKSISFNAVEQAMAKLRKRLLKALYIDECRGQRLISRKEMLENLQS